MAKVSEKDTALALALFLEFLNKIQALEAKDVQANSFKRGLAASVLAVAGDFYDGIGAPVHVNAALQEVAEGLIELNRGKSSKVLKVRLAQKVTTPLKIEMLRSEILALLYAITDGAPDDLKPRPRKAEASRLITEKLGVKFAKIARLDRDTDKPGPQFLPNLLIKARKSENDDTIAAIHFLDQKQKLSIDLLTLDRAERDRRIKAKLTDLKRRISDAEF